MFDSRQRQEIFVFSKTSKPALGPTHLPTQWVPGAISPGVKRPGRDVNHLPPSTAEVKNEWSYTSAPPICLHGVDEHNFILAFLFNDAVGSSE